MADYYTTSEYSPLARRYQDQTVPMDQQPMTPQQPMAPQPMAPQPMAPQQPMPVAPRPFTYNQGTFNIDWTDILRRAVKYLIEGLAVAFVAYYFVGRGRLNIRDIVILGITAAFVFAILDTFSPTVSLGVRFGAGFGIGQGLFGVAPGLMAAPVRALI